MNKLANKLFTLFSFTTIILVLIAGVAWLFDSTPTNLWYVFEISRNCVIMTFLFYLLFGGKRT